MDSFTGAAIWVEAHYQNPSRLRPAEDGTALQRFGELTAALVLQWFLPLLLILLSFAAFTAERENGTLRQLLSLGVSAPQLAAGKALGVGLALILVILCSAILGSVALAFSGIQDMAAVDPARLAPMAAAYAVYLAIFVIVGLTVSALASSSWTALAVLLGFWAVNCFLTPRLVADAAEQTYPSPAASDFWRQVAAEMRGADGHSDNDQRILELKRRTMERYGVSRVEDRPVNFEGLRLQAGEEHGNQVFDQHFGRLWRTYEAQEHLHHWAALASPFLAVRSISMAMAGTDLAHLRDFAQATEQYRRLNKAMNLNLANNSRTGEYYYFAGRSLWESIPEYRYDAPSAVWALRRQALPVGILTAWLAAALAALLFAVRRVRPL
jgi:ABC-2 type transport system permease protein